MNATTKGNTMDNNTTTTNPHGPLPIDPELQAWLDAYEAEVAAIPERDLECAG